MKLSPYFNKKIIKGYDNEAYIIDPDTGKTFVNKIYDAPEPMTLTWDTIPYPSTGISGSWVEEVESMKIGSEISSIYQKSLVDFDEITAEDLDDKDRITISREEVDLLMKFKKTGKGVRSVVTIRNDILPNTQECIVSSKDKEDLLPDRIMKSLSIMKGQLMMECVPERVKKIECSLTPAVKESLILANKKLNMFGKERPIVARFDEYGRRLPDVINIKTMQGMTLKIVEPQYYGEYYLELRGIVQKKSGRPGAIEIKGM